MAISVVHYFPENYMTQEHIIGNNYKLNSRERVGRLPTMSIASYGLPSACRPLDLL